MEKLSFPLVLFPKERVMIPHRTSLCPKVWEKVTVDHFHPRRVAITVTAEGENNRLVGEGGLNSVRRELDL